MLLYMSDLRLMIVTYYVYVLLCRDGSYYTGYTHDLNNRLKQHLNGKGSRYTRMNKPEKIVHTELFGSRSEAMKREREIKRLTRKQKALLTDDRNLG